MLWHLCREHLSDSVDASEAGIKENSAWAGVTFTFYIHLRLHSPEISKISFTQSSTSTILSLFFHKESINNDNNNNNHNNR